MKPSRRRSGESSSARSGGTIVTWLHMQKKLLTPSIRARLSVSAVDGAVVSKPIAKKTTSLLRVLLGDPQRVQRRVDHPDVRALGLGVQQRAVRAGDAHHVPEAREDHVLLMGQRDAVVDPAHRDHAHGAARAVHQLHVLGQQVVDPELVDRVGVPPAHLHQLVVATRLDQRQDLPRQRAAQLGVPELVDVPHAGATCPGSAWRSRCPRARARRHRGRPDRPAPPPPSRARRSRPHTAPARASSPARSHAAGPPRRRT